MEMTKKQADRCVHYLKNVSPVKTTVFVGFIDLNIVEYLEANGCEVKATMAQDSETARYVIRYKGVKG